MSSDRILYKKVGFALADKFLNNGRSMRTVLAILTLMAISTSAMASNEGFDVSLYLQKQSCDITAEGNLVATVLVRCDGVPVYTSDLMSAGNSGKEQERILGAFIRVGFKLQHLPDEVSITANSLTMRVTR